MTNLTVAICTYKRPTLLRKALQSLVNAKQIEGPWELLIIDNTGDSSAKTIAEEFSGLLPIRYIVEPKLGISYARNCAVNEACAPIILFVDDDVTFDPSWLVNMTRAINEHTECDFWGGRIEPVWLNPKPSWLDTKLCPMLGDMIVQYNLDSESRYWNPEADTSFPTANIALQVTIVKKVNLFDVTLGIVGERRIGAEDASLIKKVSQAGGKGWYVADAKVYHPVYPERTTKRYARWYAWQQGKVSIYIACQEYSFVPRWLYRVALTKFLEGLKRWIKGIMSVNSAERFTGQFIMLFNLSKLWHAVFRIQN